MDIGALRVKGESVPHVVILLHDYSRDFCVTELRG